MRGEVTDALGASNSFLLRCLGVGSGFPSAGRSHSAYLFHLGETRLLFDCGEPVSRTLKSVGVAGADLDRVFLSHLQFDHVGGFFMLMQGLWLEPRRADLTVHLPEEGIEPLSGMLRAGYLFDELLPFKLAFEPLRHGRAVLVNDVKVTPFAGCHLAGFKRDFGNRYPGPFEAFSFLIEDGARRVGHSADIGDVRDLDPLVAGPLDLLVCELAHCPSEALFRYLAGREIGRICFVHLSDELFHNLPAVRAQAEKVLGPIEISFPLDGDEVRL